MHDQPEKAQDDGGGAKATSLSGDGGAPPEFAAPSIVPAPLRLRLEVADPEVKTELSRYPEGSERDRFALAALRLGVLALRNARGELDAAAVRQAGQKLLSEMHELLAERGRELTSRIESFLTQYLDPRTGAVSQRLDTLFKRDGELVRLLEAHLGPQDSALARTLTQHLGEGSPVFKMLSPSQKDGIREQVRKVLEETLDKQRQEVLREFSLDQPQSALSRLVAQLKDRQGELEQELRRQIEALVQEFSLDKENSALARLKREVENLAEKNHDFHGEVRRTLERLEVRREERERSTRHGVDFQQELGGLLARMAARVGDVSEDVSHETGSIKNCKVGDFLVVMGQETAAPNAPIVWEAKEAAGYTLKKALAEIEEARKNRSAQIGVFVFSQKTAPSGLEPFARHGRDLVVVWNSEDARSDVVVEAAYSVARALAVRRAEDSVQVESLEQAARAIEKRLQDLEDMKRWAETVQSHGGKITERLETMKGELKKQVRTLDAQVEALRSSAAER